MNTTTLENAVNTITARETAHPGLWTSELRAALGKLARAEHAQYPQYKGYWDGPEWTVVKVTRRVKTKLGVAFEKGELALARRTPPETGSFSPAAKAELNKPSWEVYSVRTRCNTRLPLKAATPFG